MSMPPSERTIRHVVLIRNPVAGSRRGSLVDRVVRGLAAAGIVVEVRATRGAGDARRIAATLDRTSCDALLVAGGDGTINEAASGLLQRDDGGMPLGLLPIGTANVLAIELGLVRTAESIVATVVAGRVRMLRPGLLTGGDGVLRAFLLMAGMGVDAHVVAGVTPGLKRRFGKAAYGWRAAIELLQGSPRRYRIDIDGHAHEAGSVVVTRARHYAGPYIVAPQADIAGDSLQVVLLQGEGRWSMMANGVHLLRGRLSERHDVRVVPARNVKVAALGDAIGPQPIQIDGDSGSVLPADISVGPRSLEILA